MRFYNRNAVTAKKHGMHPVHAVTGRRCPKPFAPSCDWLTAVGALETCSGTTFPTLAPFS